MEAAPVLASMAVLVFAALLYSVVACRQEVAGLQDRLYQLEQPRKYRRMESTEYPNLPEVYNQQGCALPATDPAQSPTPDPSPRPSGERKRPREEPRAEQGDSQDKQERVAKMLSGVRKDSKAKFMNLIQDLKKGEPGFTEDPEMDQFPSRPGNMEQAGPVQRPFPPATSPKPPRASAFSPAAGLSLTSRNAQFKLGRSTPAASPMTTPSSEGTNAGPRLGAPSLFGRREEQIDPQEETLMGRLPYQTREFSGDRQGTSDEQHPGSGRFSDNR